MQNEVMIAASSFARIQSIIASGVIPHRTGAAAGGVFEDFFERPRFDPCVDADRLPPVLRLFGLASILYRYDRYILRERRPSSTPTVNAPNMPAAG